MVGSALLGTVLQADAEDRVRTRVYAEHKVLTQSATRHLLDHMRGLGVLAQSAQSSAETETGEDAVRFSALCQLAERELNACDTALDDWRDLSGDAVEAEVQRYKARNTIDNGAPSDD